MIELFLLETKYFIVLKVKNNLLFFLSEKNCKCEFKMGNQLPTIKVVITNGAMII